MATGKIFQIAFAINAAMNNSFSSAMMKAGQSMQMLGNEAATVNRSFALMQNEAAKNLGKLKGVEQTAQKIATLRQKAQETSGSLKEAKDAATALSSAFRKSQTETARLKAQLDQAKESARTMKGIVPADTYRAMRAEVNNLSASYKESAANTKNLGRDMKAADERVKRLQNSFGGQLRALHSAGQSYIQAGYSVRNFADSQKRLRDEIERTTAAEQRAAAMQRVLEAKQAQRLAAQNQYSAASVNFDSAKANVMSFASHAYMMAQPVMDMVGTAMKFEAAMSRVQAITNATSEDTARLTARARELGETTRFTATQSAEAMSYLGMAGWKTEQILAGMKPMLDLASAGGTDLARTADILSDDLTAFGLKAEDAGHMADVFAYTISNSNTTVEMMGETMKYAAPVARAYGATLEETAALTAMMANAGIKASQAGTSLRQGFLRLAGPPAKASKELEALGINLSDAQREMQETHATLRGLGIEMDDSLPPQQKMVAVIRQLATNTQGLSNEQRLAALQAIFGTTAASGWLNVINAGPEALEKFITALNNCDGEAARMSGTMENNAQGAATRLNSAMESLSISIGSTLLPVVADAASSMAEVAGSMAKWAAANPETTKTVIELGAAMIGLYGYLRLTALASAAYQLAIAAANASTIRYVLTSKSFTVATKLAAVAQWAFNAALAANPVGLVVAGIIALIAAGYFLIKNWDKVKAYMAEIWDSPAAAVLAFISGPIGWIIYAAAGLISHWGEVKAWFTLLWRDPGAALEVFVNMVKNKFSSMYQYVKEKWERLKYILSNPITAAVNYMEHGNVYGSMVHQATGMHADEIRGLAVGGIYRKGAFLTTFAEDGPEAAIPLDGSRRAVNLWQQAGRMLGLMPEATRGTMLQAGPIMRPTPIVSEGEILGVGRESMRSTPIVSENDNTRRALGLWQKAGEILGVGRDSEPSINIGRPAAIPTVSAPPINISLTINGNTEPEGVRRAVLDAATEAQASFEDMMERFMHERGRLSFA